MKIIISPAKKMKTDTDSFPCSDLPIFITKAEEIRNELCSQSYAQLKSLWKCNDSIADMNMKRLQHMDLYHNLTPAVLAYEGIQYRYMAPGVFSDAQYTYIQEHLRILSGFYGILKPFDGVTPYRLEMQAKLQIGNRRDLYDYWGSEIAEQLFAGTDCVVNLASKEYSMCVCRYVKPGIRFVTCVFGQLQNGKVIEKGTLCKMARGEMVRFMAENQIVCIEQLKQFDKLNYRFSPEYSDDDNIVFLQQNSGGDV